MRFNGKVAIVTGGAKGLGQAICRGLIKEGAKVAIVDKDEKAMNDTLNELANSGGQVFGMKANVGKNEEVKAVFPKIYEYFGKVDILINDAGWNLTEGFRRNSEQLWEDLINENLKSAIFCSRAVLDPMIQQRYGKIVSIATCATQGQPGEVVYTAAKGGIISFTHSLSLELARYKINVNCVSPAIMDTPLLMRGLQLGKMTKEDLARLVPWGRIPRPEDVAPAVLFLASDEAEMITGQNVSVTGGCGISMLG